MLAGAERLIERDGCAAFSLRSLARELDVRPAALYNHIGSRDELLDAVAERFVASFDLSGGGEPAWPAKVRAVAVELRTRMRDRPELAELLLTRAPGTPAGPAFLRRFLDELTGAGLNRAVAHLAWHVVLTVVLGTVQQERARGADPAGTFDAVLDAALAGIVAAEENGPSEQVSALLRAHHSAAGQDPARDHRLPGR